MRFLRSIFGLNGSSNKRTVLGKGVKVDVSQIEYISESNDKLDALHYLYKRYKGTAHEEKLKTTYEKTRQIHDYLLARSRVHELILFHIQNTDHFISAFRAIIDLHQQNHDLPFTQPKHDKARVLSGPINLFDQFRTERLLRKEGKLQRPEMVIPLSRLKSPLHLEDLKAEAPMLSVPEISINTYTRIPYRKEEGSSVMAEIGYTSTPQEKESFLLYISAQMGLNDISYVGNALVTIPNSNGNNPTGIVPVIHWEGFMYALNLNDFRLFPVKMYRKSF